MSDSQCYRLSVAVEALVVLQIGDEVAGWPTIGSGLVGNYFWGLSFGTTLGRPFHVFTLFNERRWVRLPQVLQAPFGKESNWVENEQRQRT